MSAPVWVAGVDGCPAGWVAVLRRIDQPKAPRVILLRAIAEIDERPEKLQAIAIDIPIGLAEHTGPGGRGCDVAARKVIGGRQSSIFSVPARAAVMEEDYRTACDVAFANSTPPRKVSKQCFNIFPKIREVDAWIAERGSTGVHECHPEVAFWALNDCTPLDEPKKVKSRPYPPGLALRRQLLRRAGFPSAILEENPFRTSEAAADDILDACVTSWSAERILNGTAIRFPETPMVDGNGLAMLIRA